MSPWFDNALLPLMGIIGNYVMWEITSRIAAGIKQNEPEPARADLEGAAKADKATDGALPRRNTHRI